MPLSIYSCLCIYVYSCLCICVYSCLYIHVYSCLYIYVYSCLYIHVYLCLYTHVHPYLSEGWATEKGVQQVKDVETVCKMKLEDMHKTSRATLAEAEDKYNKKLNASQKEVSAPPSGPLPSLCVCV